MWTRVYAWMLCRWHLWRIKRWGKELISVRARQVEYAIKHKDMDQSDPSFINMDEVRHLHASELTALGAIHFHKNRARKTGWIGE